MDKLILTGTMLKYDIPSKNGFVIPKECEIIAPERVPVVWNYRFADPGMTIGYI